MREGRTARAEATGDAFTFVSHEEEGLIRDVERVLGRKLERRTLPDFNYTARASEALEIPLAERIAAIRERKRAERLTEVAARCVVIQRGSWNPSGYSAWNTFI